MPLAGLIGRAGRVGMPVGREAGLAGRLGMADWGLGVATAASSLAPLGMERVFHSPSAHRPEGRSASYGSIKVRLCSSLTSSRP